MNPEFDFVGLNTVISESFKPLTHVTATTARKAGMETAIKGATPSRCHFSYFASTDLEKEWRNGYRMGKQNID